MWLTKEQRQEIAVLNKRRGRAFGRAWDVVALLKHAEVADEELARLRQIAQATPCPKCVTGEAASE